MGAGARDFWFASQNKTKNGQMVKVATTHKTHEKTRGACIIVYQIFTTTVVHNSSSSSCTMSARIIEVRAMRLWDIGVRFFGFQSPRSFRRRSGEARRKNKMTSRDLGGGVTIGVTGVTCSVFTVLPTFTTICCTSYVFALCST